MREGLDPGRSRKAKIERPWTSTFADYERNMVFSRKETPIRRNGGRTGRSYLEVSAASPCFLRLSQLYLRWNFSTRPVVSTYFILPVKNGWQAEQISTVMFFLVLRVTNLLPQPQVTVASTYSGWMPDFIGVLLGETNRYIIVGIDSR